DHVQAAGGTPEVCLVAEIRRIDDQRIAFPTAARVSEILADALVEMRASVQRDDAGFVNHLVENDHAIRTLHDLDIAVVGGAGNPGETLCDTTLPQTAVCPRVGAAAGFKAAGGAQRPV